MSSSYDREAAPVKTQQYGRLKESKGNACNMKYHKALLLEGEGQEINVCGEGKNQSSLEKSP